MAGRGPLAAAGPLWVTAALVGYLETGHLVAGLAGSVLLLALGGAAADLLQMRGPLRMLPAMPGAVILAVGAALPDPAWARALATVDAVLGRWLIAGMDERSGKSGTGVVLLVVSLIGLYETVPDPDFALVLVAAALPLLLVAWPRPLVRLGTPGAFASAGLLAWADAVGGRGRLGSVIGGALCLGLFLVIPAASILMRRARRGLPVTPVGPLGVVGAAAVQLLFALGCSRIAVHASGPSQASYVAIAYLLGAAGLYSGFSLWVRAPTPLPRVRRASHATARRSRPG